jgi:hypothetical protein
MRADCVPVKTQAGEVEAARRELDLPWRARALLTAIRGERNVAQLRRQFGGQDMDTLLEGLHELGLIALQLPADHAAPAPRWPEAHAQPDRPVQRLRAFLARQITPE